MGEDRARGQVTDERESNLQCTENVHCPSCVPPCSLPPVLLLQDDIPEDYRLLSCDEFEEHRGQLLSMLGTWDICLLKGACMHVTCVPRP